MGCGASRPADGGSAGVPAVALAPRARALSPASVHPAPEVDQSDGRSSSGGGKGSRVGSSSGKDSRGGSASALVSRVGSSALGSRVGSRGGLGSSSSGSGSVGSMSASGAPGPLSEYGRYVASGAADSLMSGGGGLRGLRPTVKHHTVTDVDDLGDDLLEGSSVAQRGEEVVSDWLDPDLETARREFRDVRLLQTADVDSAFMRRDAVHGLKLRPLPTPILVSVPDHGGPVHTGESGMAHLRLGTASSNSSGSLDDGDNESLEDFLNIDEDAEEEEEVEVDAIGSLGAVANMSVAAFANLRARTGERSVTIGERTVTIGERTVTIGEHAERTASVGERSGGDRTTTTGDGRTMTVAEDFAARTYVEIDKEWQHLSTLKLVFERAGLCEASQAQFLAALVPRRYATGEYIVRQGEMGGDMYIITSGEVAVTTGVAGVSEKLVTHLYEGHMFGEMSLVQSALRNANVHATTGVEVQSISAAAFTPLLESDAAFRTFITAIVESRELAARKRAELQQLSAAADEAAASSPAPGFKVSQRFVKRRTKAGHLVVNGYALVRKLGAGAYGTVWLAQQVERPFAMFAVKVVSRAAMRRKLRGAAGGQQQSDAEMLREVSLLKYLSHPNIVALLEVIDDPAGDKLYMVQEYMELGSVFIETEFNEPLAPEIARSFVREVLLGLEYLHRNGVVHRDIKPSNTLVSAEGVAKLADFGASALALDTRGTLTDVKGTPAFQAPELFALEPGASYNGFAVDIWALGATLHTMVVGVPPYMAASEIELAELLLSKDEFRLSAAVQLDPHLKNLLQRCLTKSPHARATLPEVLEHAWITEEGVSPLVVRPYPVLDLLSLLQQDAAAATASPAAADADAAGAGLSASPLPSRDEDDPPAPPSPPLRGAAGPSPPRVRGGLQLPSSPLAKEFEAARALSGGAGGAPDAAPAEGSRAAASSAAADAAAALPAAALPDKPPSLRSMNAKREALAQAHLVRLRMRQHGLMRGHAGLSSRDQDLLADQRRVALHVDRAEATVTELYVDAGGMIRGGSDAGAPDEQVGQHRAEPGGLQLVPHLHLTPPSSEAGGSVASDATATDARGSSVAVSAPSARSTFHDTQHTNTSSSSFYGDNPLTRLNSGSSSDMLQVSSARSLARTRDFLMITAEAEPVAGGGSLVRKVVFHSRSEEGSLSISGGRTNNVRRVSLNNATSERRVSLHNASSERRVSVRALQTSESMYQMRRTSGSVHSPIDDGKGDSYPLTEVDDDENGSGSDASSSESGSDAYAGIMSLDEPMGGDSGSSLAERLDFAIAEAPASASGSMHGASTASSVAAEMCYAPLSDAEAAQWVAARRSGWCATMGNRSLKTPEAVYAASLADLAAADAAAASARDAKGLSKGRGSGVASHRPSVTEGMGFTSSTCTLVAADNAEAEELARVALAGAAAPAPTPRELLVQAAAASWPAALHKGRFVCCPAGASVRLGLAYGTSQTLGHRATMEDRSVAVPSMRAVAAVGGGRSIAASSSVGAASGAGAANSAGAASGAGIDSVAGVDSGASVDSGGAGADSGTSSADSDGAGTDFAYFAVYDGHNGVGTCEALSQALHQRVGDALLALEDSEGGGGDGGDAAVSRALCTTFLDFDAQLQAHVLPGEPISGSTACVLLVRGGAGGARTLFCANVGDSRAVLCRAGAPVALSTDHKCSNPSERARVLAAGGTIVKDRLHGVLAVSRSFGDAEHKRLHGAEMWGREFSADPCTAEPEVLAMPLLPSDEFAVVASDGVWDVLTSQQVVAFVVRRLLVHRDAARAARDLVTHASSLGSIDNISAIVVGFAEGVPL